MIPQILEMGDVAYPSSHLNEHNSQTIMKVPTDKPPAVLYAVYYSQSSRVWIHSTIDMPLLPPYNLASFKLEILEQNYSVPQETNLFIWMYLPAKLWLSCDIQCLTPLTFNSNSLCLVAELEHGAVCHLNRSVLSWAWI